MKSRSVIIGVRELRTHLSAYLRQVARGEIITVGDRNKQPIARLVPVEMSSDRTRLQALAAVGAVSLGSGKPGQGRRVRARKPRRNISDLVVEDR